MIGRSMLAYVPVNLANVIVSFGTIVILTRLFSGAEFGLYAVAMISLQFVHMSFLTWMEAALARYQARAERDNDVNSFLKTLYVSAGVTAAMGFCLIMLTLKLLPLDPRMKVVLMFALGSTCLQVFMNLSLEAHKASHRIRRYSAIYTTQTLLSFSIGIFLILATPLREQAPFIGIVIATALCLMIDLPFMLRRMRGGSVEVARIKTYFIYGMPICISLLLTYTLNSADMFLITGFLGAEAAGQYNAGYNLANRTIDILFIWMAMAVTPVAVTALEHEGLDRSRQILSEYGAMLLWVALPAATGIALVASDAGFILGEPVRDQAVKIMPLIAFAGVLNGLISYYAQRAFMLSGRTDRFVWAMLPPVILNIGLNIIWIPAYGLMGAVYATVAAYGLGLILSIVIARRDYPLPLPIIAGLKISAACAVMALGVNLAPISDSLPDWVSLLVKAGIGGLIYAALSFIFNLANMRRIVIGFYQNRKDVPQSASPIEDTSIAAQSMEPAQ